MHIPLVSFTGSEAVGRIMGLRLQWTPLVHLHSSRFIRPVGLSVLEIAMLPLLESTSSIFSAHTTRPVCLSLARLPKSITS